MMLGEIRDYLQRRGSSSLHEVATHFDIAPDTAQFALNYWQKKGKVREQPAASCGGGCGSSCSSGGGGAAPLYEWVRREVPLRWMPWRRGA